MTAPAHLRPTRVLRLLAGFGSLRRDQLQELLFPDGPLTPPSCRVLTYRVLADLKKRGLVEATGLPGTKREAFVAYALSAGGHRAYAATDPCYPRGRAGRISVVLVDHAVVLGDIALGFARAVRFAGDIACAWESDWEAVARLGSMAAVPDALLTLDRGGWRTRAFVEADRATERSEAFARKVRRYIEVYRGDTWRSAFRVWPLILTVTTSPAHARELARLAYRIAEAEGGARIARAFRFCALDELCAAGALARIWVSGDGPDRTALLDDPAPRPTEA